VLVHVSPDGLQVSAINEHTGRQVYCLTASEDPFDGGVAAAKGRYAAATTRAGRLVIMDTVKAGFLRSDAKQGRMALLGAVDEAIVCRTLDASAPCLILVYDASSELLPTTAWPAPCDCVLRVKKHGAPAGQHGAQESRTGVLAFSARDPRNRIALWSLAGQQLGHVDLDLGPASGSLHDVVELADGTVVAATRPGHAAGGWRLHFVRWPAGATAAPVVESSEFPAGRDIESIRADGAEVVVTYRDHGGPPNSASFRPPAAHHSEQPANG
jgi:hypothetical protein